MKKVVIGFILGAILTLSVGSYAESFYQFFMSDDSLIVDGNTVSKPMYKYNDTNYVSIRAAAETLGVDVGYKDGKAILTSKNLETVAQNCKNSCVMIYAYLPNGTASQGSGWVYNGYVVTAKHVIEGATKIDIFLDDSEYGVSGTVFYKDPSLDVAVLKASTGLPSVTLGDSDKLTEGEKLVSITSPHGVINSIDECVYSGKVVTQTENDINITDTFMSNGSSGGPVFNYNAQLIGMAYNGADGLIGAIPINDIKPILGKLK